MNNSLGAKLAWRLITGKPDWWKLALLNKYFQSSRLRCFDGPIPSLPGSPIWRLLKNVAPLIQAKLSWAPGNGDLINIWMDRILNREPLNTHATLQPLKDWCCSNGFSKLRDFFLWSTEGDWINWKSPNPPDFLNPLLPIFFNNLVGCAPPNRSISDSRSWGGKSFSVKDGYTHLLSEIQGPPPPSNIWKEIWSGPSLPKINTFCWLLVHGKILTAENLLKRGIQGPSHCPFCLTASETITHLFMECNFTTQLWNLIYLPLPISPPPPENWNNLFTFWKQRYVGSFKNKKQFTLLWRQIPKFVCWELWLARNQAIFREKLPPMHSIFAKICGLISEVFKTKAIGFDLPGILDQVKKNGLITYGGHQGLSPLS
jgi:hypothetical protein